MFTIRDLRKGIICLSLILLTPVVVADGYLDALKAEAATSAPGEEASQSVTPAASLQNKPSIKSELTAGADKQGFEDDLQQNFYGSFLFYQKLTDTDKERVFAFYQDVPQISRIRRKILQVMTHRQ